MSELVINVKKSVYQWQQNSQSETWRRVLGLISVLLTPEGTL